MAALIPLPLDPVTGRGAFIEADIVSYLELYSGLLPRYSCGGGAFIEGSTLPRMEHCFLPFSHPSQGGELSLRN